MNENINLGPILGVNYYLHGVLLTINDLYQVSEPIQRWAFFANGDTMVNDIDLTDKTPEEITAMLVAERME